MARKKRVKRILIIISILFILLVSIINILFVIYSNKLKDYTLNEFNQLDLPVKLDFESLKIQSYFPTSFRFSIYDINAFYQKISDENEALFSVKELKITLNLLSLIFGDSYGLVATEIDGLEADAHWQQLQNIINSFDSKTSQTTDSSTPVISTSANSISQSNQDFTAHIEGFNKLVIKNSTILFRDKELDLEFDLNNLYYYQDQKILSLGSKIVNLKNNQQDYLSTRLSVYRIDLYEFIKKFENNLNSFDSFLQLLKKLDTKINFKFDSHITNPNIYTQYFGGIEQLNDISQINLEFESNFIPSSEFLEMHFLNTDFLLKKNKILLSPFTFSANYPQKNSINTNMEHLMLSSNGNSLLEVSDFVTHIDTNQTQVKTKINQLDITRINQLSKNLNLPSQYTKFLYQLNPQAKLKNIKLDLNLKSDIEQSNINLIADIHNLKIQNVDFIPELIIPQAKLNITDFEVTLLGKNLSIHPKDRYAQPIKIEKFNNTIALKNIEKSLDLMMNFNLTTPYEEKINLSLDVLGLKNKKIDFNLAVNFENVFAKFVHHYLPNDLSPEIISQFITPISLYKKNDQLKLKGGYQIAISNQGQINQKLNLEINNLFFYSYPDFIPEIFAQKIKVNLDNNLFSVVAKNAKLSGNKIKYAQFDLDFNQAEAFKLNADFSGSATSILKTLDAIKPVSNLDAYLQFKKQVNILDAHINAQVSWYLPFNFSSFAKPYFLKAKVRIENLGLEYDNMIQLNQLSGAFDFDIQKGVKSIQPFIFKLNQSKNSQLDFEVNNILSEDIGKIDFKLKGDLNLNHSSLTHLFKQFQLSKILGNKNSSSYSLDIQGNINQLSATVQSSINLQKNTLLHQLDLPQFSLKLNKEKTDYEIAFYANEGLDLYDIKLKIVENQIKKGKLIIDQTKKIQPQYKKMDKGILIFINKNTLNVDKILSYFPKGQEQKTVEIKDTQNKPKTKTQAQTKTQNQEFSYDLINQYLEQYFHSFHINIENLIYLDKKTPFKMDIVKEQNNVWNIDFLSFDSDFNFRIDNFEKYYLNMEYLNIHSSTLPKSEKASTNKKDKSKKTSTSTNKKEESKVGKYFCEAQELLTLKDRKELYKYIKPLKEIDIDIKNIIYDSNFFGGLRVRVMKPRPFDLQLDIIYQLTNKIFLDNQILLKDFINQGSLNLHMNLTINQFSDIAKQYNIGQGKMQISLFSQNIFKDFSYNSLFGYGAIDMKRMIIVNEAIETNPLFAVLRLVSIDKLIESFLPNSTKSKSYVIEAFEFDFDLTEEKLLINQLNMKSELIDFEMKGDKTKSCDYKIHLEGNVYFDTIASVKGLALGTFNIPLVLLTDLIIKPIHNAVKLDEIWRPFAIKLRISGDAKKSEIQVIGNKDTTKQNNQTDN